MKPASLVIAVLLGITSARGDVIYDVSFDGPGYVTNAISPAGDPPFYPQGTYYVVYSPVFDSQVDVLSYLRFDPAGSFSSGVHAISWQYMTESENTYGGWPNMAVTFSGSSVFVPDGSFGDAYLYITNSPQVGAPTPLNQVIEYAVTIDLDAMNVSFSVDGILYATNAPIPAGSTLDSVHMQRPGNNAAYIDSFRWEIVPEPSTLIMVLLGTIGIAMRNRIAQPRG
ncbi:MAG: PEP-CTERM sorting domain-containing protein [Kiritimatiellae bacterium]|nr:PEP-CTERM sorting domain-containing protein [Kiritimatiellia bacterium]